MVNAVSFPCQSFNQFTPDTRGCRKEHHSYIPHQGVFCSTRMTTGMYMVIMQLNWIILGSTHCPRGYDPTRSYTREHHDIHCRFRWWGRTFRPDNSPLILLVCSWSSGQTSSRVWNQKGTCHMCRVRDRQPRFVWSDTSVLVTTFPPTRCQCTPNRVSELCSVADTPLKGSGHSSWQQNRLEGWRGY